MNEERETKKKGEVKGQYLFMQWVLTILTIGVLVAFFLMIVVF